MESYAKNCADGAYAPIPPSLQCVKDAIAQIHSYRRANDKLYGSNRLILDDNLWRGVRREIEDAILRLCGRRLDDFPQPISDSQLKMLWDDTRKGNFKKHHRSVPVAPKDEMPLLEDLTPGAIYAFTGCIGYFARVVKIGFTAGDVDKYLRAKEYKHHPKLLGHGSFTKQDEEAFHRSPFASPHKATGREWYYPDDPVKLWILKTMPDTVPTFDELWKEAKAACKGRYAE